MLNHHDDGMPIIARLHEVRAAAELTGDEAIASVQAPAKPARVLPFVGEVAHYEPGVAVTVEHRLSLDEDLYLADHHFVHANDVKPLSACFPVVPMTVSLEIMAEAAACLAPGYGLIGFEQVSAARWIALADTDALALRVEGRIRGVDPARAICRIDVEVYASGETKPSISATVLFSSRYQKDLGMQFDMPRAKTRISAGRIYEERALFHGPLFQRLTGEISVGEHGVHADLLVNSPAKLLRSTSQPQLLTDPALLDAVGQAMAVWTSQQGGVVFPIGLGKMEFYRPTPAPGTRVPMRVKVTSGTGKMLAADVEIEDGQGGVWLRVKEWRSWRFQWDRKLVEFRREPARYLLSDDLELPPGAADADAVARRVTKACLTGFDLELLARHYLTSDEMAVFGRLPHHGGKHGEPGRQKSWLLGRIAAKDALRAWRTQGAASAGSATSAGTACSNRALHPAAFGIGNDAHGKPFVTHWPDPVAPSLSIAHSCAEAVAVVQSRPVGVDIEPVASRDDGFVRAMATAFELALLDGVAQRDVCITRLWCAKEAFGKCLGTGAASGPHRFEAVALDAAGALRMSDRDSGREARVTTWPVNAMIVAVCRQNADA
ncbi:4'-phosphopantetheinyl transferase EntD [Paraburkholderia bannensis]|uniref:4'-phosphopantetheinyl transferase EntD n=1 Tax=Paraburkholderia bannensis TaxID=765414 RepID=A0A7W9TYB0_9BURK|nr:MULTISPECIES: polyketide synthase dehydratase domain-containing protein [Paraburkholderia]MBB3258640.1 4'-phosphopantetheinyl transferase EntD [Paraburkholderia sp. WP4_3_2]MBB6103653.1 4'-phosphopantetheinyl transferase EntD [Paraburkholderia bannensis]